MTPTLPKFWPEEREHSNNCHYWIGRIDDDCDCGARYWDACLSTFTALYLKGELVAKSELPTEDELLSLAKKFQKNDFEGYQKSFNTLGFVEAISKRMRGEK